MLLIKILDHLSNMFTEFVYMVACVLYKVWQYRIMLTVFVYFAVLVIGGLVLYCIQVAK